MPSFSLRPVEASPSPTASPASASAVGSVAGSPPQLARPASASPAGPAPTAVPPQRRRRLSPSSLRDVDLTQRPVSASPLQRRPPFPLPPTGHDLMALFPAQPPAGAPELRAGPTSGYFARQERAFFAQAGKEIVRVRLDIDLPPSPASAHDGERASMAGKPRAAALPRPWPGTTGSPRTAPATSPGTAPTPAPYPALTRPRAQSSLPPTPVFPPAPHPHPLHHRTPSSDAPPPAAEYAAPPPPPGPGTGPVAEEFRADDPDEAWRRPMPYNERRRAGKHTRRVVVRN